jgi:sec-independent protein translocase protein TatB
MSFGEVVLLGVIAIVVVGPRNLIPLMRDAGKLIGRVRKMAMDIRAESGIDEILDHEGIRSEIDHFKRLAAGEISPDDPMPNVVPDREREYPRGGPDVYGALSEDVAPYLPSPPLSSPPVPAALPPAPLPLAAPVSAQPSTNGAGVKS